MNACWANLFEECFANVMDDNRKKSRRHSFSEHSPEGHSLKTF